MINLYNGDCLEKMRDIPDSSVDIVLADPPYGTTKCAFDKVIPMTQMWTEIIRVVKRNAPILLFSAQPFTTELIVSNRKMFRYEIIWEKTQVAGFLNAKKMPLRTHENICVFYKKLPTYNPQMTTVERNDMGRVRKNGGNAQQYNEYRNDDWFYQEDGLRYPRDVIKFSNWNGALFGKTENATKHPMQKPTALLQYLVTTYSNKGDTVLDFCMGSGSTGVACANVGRSFIGIELDKEYFEIADKRIKAALGEERGE